MIIPKCPICCVEAPTSTEISSYSRSETSYIGSCHWFRRERGFSNMSMQATATATRGIWFKTFPGTNINKKRSRKIHGSTRMEPQQVATVQYLLGEGAEMCTSNGIQLGSKKDEWKGWICHNLMNGYEWQGWVSCFIYLYYIYIYFDDFSWAMAACSSPVAEALGNMMPSTWPSLEEVSQWSYFCVPLEQR